MTTDRSSGNERRGKSRHTRAGKPQAEQAAGSTVIKVERSGDWLPVEEFRSAVLAAVESGSDVIIDLDKINHLDASALQVLLALVAEQKKRGRSLVMENSSSSLRHWFEYAGAAQHFFADGAKQQ